MTRRAPPPAELGATQAREARASAAPWSPPTRRAFVAMIGAAAASLATRGLRQVDDTPGKRLTGAPRWIGHC